jgi:hypothetical protein
VPPQKEIQAFLRSDGGNSVLWGEAVRYAGRSISDAKNVVPTMSGDSILEQKF